MARTRASGGGTWRTAWSGWTWTTSTSITTTASTGSATPRTSSRAWASGCARRYDQGLIKHICCSFHDNNEALIKLVDTGYVESITLQYNLLNRDLEEGIAYAQRKGRGRRGDGAGGRRPPGRAFGGADRPGAGHRARARAGAALCALQSQRDAGPVGDEHDAAGARRTWSRRRTRSACRQRTRRRSASTSSAWPRWPSCTAPAASTACPARKRSTSRTSSSCTTWARSMACGRSRKDGYAKFPDAALGRRQAGRRVHRVRRVRGKVPAEHPDSRSAQGRARGPRFDWLGQYVNWPTG